MGDIQTQGFKRNGERLKLTRLLAKTMFEPSWPRSIDLSNGRAGQYDLEFESGIED